MFKRALVTALMISIFAAGCQAYPSAADAAADAGKTVSVDKASGAATAVNLADISSHWARDSILNAIKKGYVDGYEDGTFRPDQNVTRAEFIKMAITAMNKKVGAAATGASWYDAYVQAADTAGIHKASDFTTGDWNTPITRLEMARIAVRAIKPELQNPAVHTDDISVMYNAVKTGLLQGLGAGELGMDQATNRAQSVTIIERILSVLNGVKLDVDKYALSSAELKLKKTNIFTVIPEFFGGKQVEGVNWNPDNLALETPDGKWKGELDQLIAIDLDDPNDPNLSLLPDINTLHFFNFNGPEDGPLVKDFPHSYIIYYKSHVDYNKDTHIYDDGLSYMDLEISGFKSPSLDDFSKGSLNTLANVFQKRVGDLPAMIIPKNALTSGTIYIQVNSPARAPNPQYNKSILGVGVADKSRWIN